VDLLESLACNPIEGMARMAMDEKHPPQLRGRMYAELAQYVYPKRKAIEHKGDAPDGPTMEVVILPADVPRGCPHKR